MMDWKLTEYSSSLRARYYTSSLSDTSSYIMTTHSRASFLFFHPQRILSLFAIFLAVCYVPEERESLLLSGETRHSLSSPLLCQNSLFPLFLSPLCIPSNPLTRPAFTPSSPRFHWFSSPSSFLPTVRRWRLTFLTKSEITFVTRNSARLNPLYRTLSFSFFVSPIPSFYFDRFFSLAFSFLSFFFLLKRIYRIYIIQNIDLYTRHHKEDFITLFLLHFSLSLRQPLGDDVTKVMAPSETSNLTRHVTSGIYGQSWRWFLFSIIFCEASILRGAGKGEGRKSDEQSYWTRKNKQKKEVYLAIIHEM